MMGVGRLEALARIGFAARGLLYLMIGYLALRAGRPEDGHEALERLQSGGGRLVLAAMALGFFGYGLWRVSEAFIDSQGHGGDAKGIVLRLGGAISGLIHLALAVFAAKLALGGGSGGGQGPEQGAATALSLPGGQLALTLAAAIGLLAAGYQLVKAARASFLRHLDPVAAKQPAVAWAGRAGYAARGLVFGIMAYFAWQAARAARASEAGDMGDALASLPDGLQWLVAGGLILFGLFSLVEARFRRITDPHVLARLKAAAERVAA